jgi:hypothetical protein
MLRCNITQGVLPMASFAEFNRNRASHDTSGEAFDFLGFATFVRGIQLFRQALADSRAERRERVQIARELSTYTDRELGELGFSRADLPMIAAGTYRR